jgi:hypothetical protein
MVYSLVNGSASDWLLIVFRVRQPISTVITSQMEYQLKQLYLGGILALY